MPEPGGREAQSSPEQGKAQLAFIWGFLEKICVSEVLFAWLEKPGVKVWSSGWCCRAAQELVLVTAEAVFHGQSSPGFTGMAEVGQKYLEEGLNVGRRSWWR